MKIAACFPPLPRLNVRCAGRGVDTDTPSISHTGECNERAWWPWMGTEAATSIRRFCLLLAVSNPLWQPNLDFSSFRSVPSLSQQTRAEGRNIRPNLEGVSRL